MNLLSAQNLEKKYGTLTAVCGVSLEVRAGQVTGLLGPNGAGKTSCFYMIAGLVAPDRGRLFLDGDDITALPMYRRARRGIGYLPQEPSIFRGMNVRDNLLAILETRRGLNRRDREARADSLLERFQLGKVRDTKAHLLSGGERRRVEIARMLALAPRFLLLDEPFAGIDPVAVQDLKDLLQHLQSEGLGVLLTDHNVREALDICDTACILSEGRLLAEGSPEKIAADPRVRQVYLGESF